MGEWCAEDFLRRYRCVRMVKEEGLVVDMGRGGEGIGRWHDSVFA